MDETTTVDEGGEFDPKAAARLLETTKRQAQRQFEFPSPLLSLIQAAAVLAAYGAIWLSVRGQDPYQGPSYAALAALYAFVAVAAIAATWEGRRASAGVSRRSSRQQWSRAIPLVAAFLAVYVLMGALLHDGFSHAIVYGIVPAAGPLIVVGAAMAGYAAAREDWQVLGVTVALVAVGAGSAFAGPAGVWEVAGVGCCAVLVCRAIAQIWLRRA
jgi:membrane protease YdiL (CAAX protease family)